MRFRSTPAVACVLALSAPGAFADEPVRTGAAAFGDWRGDAPGVQRLITPADLPPPFATRPAANPSRAAARKDGQYPKAPPGFEVELFAENLDRPRVVRRAPNGDLFVAESGAGRIRVYRPQGAKGQAGDGAVFAEGLERPFGIAFYPSDAAPRFVYVATPVSVLRYPYRSGDMKAGSPPETIARLPSGGNHWTRDLAFSTDNRTLYVSVGSASNVQEGAARPDKAEIAAAPFGAAFGDERDRAVVLAFDPDGGHRRTIATGIRNCSGLTIQPATGALWCAVNERDGLGDDLPPDFATRVIDGAFYGWPWFYIGAHEDPRHRGERPDLASHVASPDFLLQPHSAPLGITFYEGGSFPPEYGGDAFVAFQGSWNRAKRTGYKVVRLRMKDGKPTGAVEDFLTGFVNPDDSVWGRPIDIAETQDGALIVSDEGGGILWRVRWTGRP
jgi:glucose/arabinose dehydrogenase